MHGDVRERSDLEALPRVDALVECSAEPSALAGAHGDTAYPVGANLLGAYHCLELARRDGAEFVFLSTSRVYPFGTLGTLRLEEAATRLELADAQDVPGASVAGIAEDFPLEGARTLYGATKLAAELLIAEYAAGFGLPTVIDRCGVIAGPWQMGKVDQGCLHLLDAGPTTSAGRCAISASAPAASRCATCSTSRRPRHPGRRPARAPRPLARGNRQRRRRARREPVAAGDHGPVPGADRDRDRRWRRPTRSGLATSLSDISDCRRLQTMTDWRPRA